MPACKPRFLLRSWHKLLISYLLRVPACKPRLLLHSWHKLLISQYIFISVHIYLSTYLSQYMFIGAVPARKLHLLPCSWYKLLLSHYMFISVHIYLSTYLSRYMFIGAVPARKPHLLLRNRLKLPWCKLLIPQHISRLSVPARKPHLLPHSSYLSTYPEFLCLHANRNCCRAAGTSRTSARCLRRRLRSTEGTMRALAKPATRYDSSWPQPYGTNIKSARTYTCTYGVYRTVPYECEG